LDVQEISKTDPTIFKQYSNTHQFAIMPHIDRKRKIHKTNAKAVEAISFDPEARQEYLSGFHKRKVQRAEHGRELAQRKMKEATVQARKEVRMMFLEGV
jgi:hypothetical protein